MLLHCVQHACDWRNLVKILVGADRRAELCFEHLSKFLGISWVVFADRSTPWGCGKPVFVWQKSVRLGWRHSSSACEFLQFLIGFGFCDSCRSLSVIAEITDNAGDCPPAQLDVLHVVVVNWIDFTAFPDNLKGRRKDFCRLEKSQKVARNPYPIMIVLKVKAEIFLKNSESFKIMPPRRRQNPLKSKWHCYAALLDGNWNWLFSIL